jgi:hypothetical protein
LSLLGAVALGVYAALCFHFMLPFETRVPGFSTFTVLKLLAFVLILVSLPRWRSLDFGRAAGRAAAALAPFVFLAGWLVAVSVAHPVHPWWDVKLLLGFAAGAYAGLVLAVLGERETHRRAVFGLVLVGGVIAIAGGALEPLTTPAWDGLWRLFRPYVTVWDPVRGQAVPMGEIHRIEGGQFRVAGFFSNFNQLANFLVIWFPLAAAAAARARRPGWPAWAGLAAAALVFAHTLTRSSILAAGGGCAVAVGAATVLGPGRRADRPRWGPVAVACLLLVLAVAAITTRWLNPVRAAYAGIAVLLALVWANRKDRPASAIAPSSLRRFALVGILILAAVPVTAWIQPVTVTRLGESGGSAVSWRRSVWTIAAREVRNAPLIGPGYHAFWTELVRHRELAGAGIDSPHNLYLTAAVAGGIPAAGLLILGLVVLLRVAWRRAFEAGVAGDRLMGLALLWYWVAYVPLGLVGQDIFRVNDAVFFFAWAGLTVTPPLTALRRAR